MTSGVTSASSGSLVDPEPRSATQSPTLWESNHLLSSTLECGNTDLGLHNGYQTRRLVGCGLLVGFKTLVSVSVSVLGKKGKKGPKIHFGKFGVSKTTGGGANPKKKT